MVEGARASQALYLSGLAVFPRAMRPATDTEIGSHFSLRKRAKGQATSRFGKDDPRGHTTNYRTWIPPGPPILMLMPIFGGAIS
jgi:hypothetical protein